MVFPLLGILGLAASAAAKPFYDDWVEGRRGDRAEDALAGLAPGADIGQQGRALMGAGLLSPQDYLSGQFDLGRLMQGQQGLALDQQRLGLDRDRFGQDERRMAMDQAYRMAGRYDYAPIGQVTPDLMAAAKEAIASKESAGQANPYAALGPVTPGGDRAIGKYQVMGANVPGWTEAALGVRMTPEEFAASPEAQEAVFENRFGGYLDRYGNFEDAASSWFSGRPAAQALRETPQGDGFSRTADYIGETSTVFRRRLGLVQGERERAARLRELELSQADAAAPLRDGAARADTVLQGLDQIGRFGSGYLNTPEGKALSDQTVRAGEELFHDWRRSVYGEAEPSQVVMDAFREVFPAPGGNLASRERQARYFANMRAEMNRKADYEEAKLAYKAGLIGKEELRALNGGRLTRAEREELARGDWRPPGFRPVADYAVPDAAGAAAAAPYQGRGGGHGRRAD